MEKQFPKNVRQIGNVCDSPKIYVEDYVDTFLNQLAINGWRAERGFLIGEKGSGKTAYSVYMSKSDKINSFCSISLVENTLYQRFLNMKRQKALELQVSKMYGLIWFIWFLQKRSEKNMVRLFFSSMKYKQLSKAIDVFYSDAFKPEFVNAFEFVDNASASINSMMKQGLFSTGTKASAETSQKYVEQSFRLVFWR